MKKNIPKIPSTLPNYHIKSMAKQKGKTIGNIKTLYIIRHAKSSWGDPTLRDFDRPLSKKGKDGLHRVSNILKQKKISPDIFYSSPAKRAKKTSEKISSTIGYPKNKIIYDQNIYDKHMDTINFYLQLIMTLPDEYNKAFIVGHNPAWNELTQFLLGKDIGNIPTSGVVSISFHIESWRHISHHNGNMEFFLYPKMKTSENKSH